METSHTTKDEPQKIITKVVDKFIEEPSPVDAKVFISEKPKITAKQFVDMHSVQSNPKRFIEGVSFNQLSQEFISGESAKKNTLEIVSDIASTPNLSRKVRAQRIIDQTIGVKSSASLYSTLTSWLRASYRPILWAVAWGIAISIGVGLVYLMFTAGSWGLFLGMLQYLGVKVLPSAISNALKNAGMSVASQLSTSKLLQAAKKSERIQKILQTKVPDAYIRSTMKRIGVDLGKEQMTVEDMSTTVINNGLSVGFYFMTGNPYGYVYSTGLSLATTVGKKMVGKAAKIAYTTSDKIVKGVDIIRQRTANTILSGGNVPKTVVETINELDPKTTPAIKTTVDAPNRTETTRTFTNTIVENKKAVFATTAAVALVTVALAGDASAFTEMMKTQVSAFGESAVQKLGELSLTGFNIAKKSSVARTALTNFLLQKAGVNKITELFADKLTPGQKKELRSLAEAIKTEKNESTLAKLSNKFIGLLSGGYYTSDKLKKMSRDKLLSVYKKIAPPSVKRNIGRYTVQQLRDAIVREQTSRLTRLNGMVSNYTQTALNTITATVVQESVVEGYSYYKATSAQIDEELAKIEGMKLREESIKEAHKAKEELAKVRRAEAKAASTAARARQKARAKLEKIRKDAAHTKALERAKIRAAERDLRSAALAEQLSRTADVIILQDDGVAHPLPPENLILPESLQKSLDWEFTPLGQYAAKEIAKSSTNWIPGLGWVQGAIQKVNMGLTTAETAKNLGKVAEVVTRLHMGEVPSDIEPVLGKLDDVLSVRVPDLTTAVEDIIKTDKLNAKEIVLRTLKDKIIEGWDAKKVAYEIGKAFLIGTGDDIGIDITEMYGYEIWKQAFA